VTDVYASIVIPTFNGTRRIGTTLDALSIQETAGRLFEVIVVDNNSTDGIFDFIRSHPAAQEMVRRGIECRIVREERQGASFARIRGAGEARSEYICFLDDDNVPEKNYVAEGVAALSENSAIGLLVSRIIPKYEIPPPPSVAKREYLLAINQKLGDEIIDWGAVATLAPTIGAGLWLRREAFFSAVPWQNPERLMHDRFKNRLTSGGDIEMGWLIGKAGYKRVYWPRLRVWHIIPKERFEVPYFTRLISGIVRSEMTLEKRINGGDGGILDRLLAGISLFFTGLAIPILLLREDGLRETIFVLASRLARLRGPYKI
jgi:glycosyltransferase involved in cell wall biosynthesis